MTRITAGIAPLWQALQTAAAADEQPAKLWDQLQRNRRISMARYAEALAAKAPIRHDVDTVTDILWALPDSYLRLVYDRGWAVFAEFEVDLLKMRTREGMAIARSHGKLNGKRPKLTARQQAELARMRATDYTIADLMKVFSVGRATVYRVLGRAVDGHPSASHTQPAPR